MAASVAGCVIPLQRVALFGCTERVSQPGATSIRIALRSAVAKAIKQRDRMALAVYRTALAAIDNAEAVPVSGESRAGAIERSAIGVGQADVQRQRLTEQDMIEVVRLEAEDRRTTADDLKSINPDASEQLRHEAELLFALLR